MSLWKKIGLQPKNIEFDSYSFLEIWSSDPNEIALQIIY